MPPFEIVYFVFFDFGFDFPGNFNLEGHVAVDFDFPEAIGLRGNEISWEAFARRRFFFRHLLC